MKSQADSEERVELDTDRQIQARHFARQRLYLRGVSLVLSVGLLTLAGPGGAAVAVRDWAARATAVWPLQVLCFFLVLGVVAAAVELPLTYYRNFVLPVRHGMSNQSFGGWAADLVKGGVLTAVLGLVSLEILYGFLRWTPDAWWAWTGLVFIVLSVILVALAPVLIVPLFFRLSALSDETLVRDIVTLAERAETSVIQVRQIDLSSKSPAANAAVVGLGRTRKIVLGDTLLSSFPRSEVLVVVAHELGHHVHRDLPRPGVGSGTFHGRLFRGQPRPPCRSVRLALLRHVRPRAISRVSGRPGGMGHPERHGDSRPFPPGGTQRGRVFALLDRSGGRIHHSEIRLTNQNLSWFDPPRWLEAVLYTHPAPCHRVAMGEAYLAAANQSTFE